MSWIDEIRARPGLEPEFETVSDRDLGEVHERTIVFEARPGVRRAAGLIAPLKAPINAAILFLHWYEPESADSNRTQFEAEASGLAPDGVVSLLIETMWSDRDWFIKRSHEDDYRAAIDQVFELQSAIALLRHVAGNTGSSLNLVGHDFGAMFGVLLGAVEPDLATFVLMAGTPRFSEWYFYYPELSEKARISYQARMDAIDPASNIPGLNPRPILFQFGLQDPHVPKDRAETFAAAYQGPKEVRWYDAGHGLNQTARSERLAWIRTQLAANTGRNG